MLMSALLFPPSVTSTPTVKIRKGPMSVLVKLDSLAMVKIVPVRPRQSLFVVVVVVFIYVWCMLEC